MKRKYFKKDNGFIIEMSKDEFYKLWSLLDVVKIHELLSDNKKLVDEIENIMNQIEEMEIV